MKVLSHGCRLMGGLAIAVSAGLAQAAQWSTTEVQLQYGNLDKAFQGGGSDAETGGTTIMTFQHASGWAYGDNFFFMDYLNYGQTDFEKANGMHTDDEIYGEWYSNFSLGKIFDTDLGFGPVRDLGLIMGFNFAQEVDTLYYLPGVRFALNLPGFAFANIDVTAYIQDSSSAPSPGVSISDDSSFMVDFNWAYPFKIGATSWTIEGHIEYIDGADQDVRIDGVGTVPGERESWVLAQPQVRMDVGELFGTPDTIFAGIEYQYWSNKLGDKDTDESVVQALLVWRL